VAERCDVIAIGPGLGLADETIELVDGVLRKFNRPVVADADAINALAKRWVPRKAPLILTPHEGELSRLIGLPAEVIRKDRERVAVETARKLRAILVLKGRGTIVTDGARTYVNPTGNPAMATAGSGDVLTGIIAALVGQKLEPFEAAQLGVWLHGRAGDLAALERPALIAGDLIDALPRALRERSNKR
jgi:NAD(P)H-hydrate epimerase